MNYETNKLFFLSTQLNLKNTARITKMGLLNKWKGTKWCYGLEGFN